MTMARKKGTASAARDSDLKAQAAEDNKQMLKFLDLEARGLDPLTGQRAAREPAVPWIRGDRETWILELVADYERHFQKTGNPYFILAAYDASGYLPNRAIHKVALTWVDVGLALIVKSFLAGDNPLGVGRGHRSLREQTHKILRDGAIALKVLNQLPIERDNETLAIQSVAEAEKLSPTTIGNAWRELKENRQRRH
jgi:hypothetical protein